MARITRWDPFKELEEIQSRMTRMFEEAFGRSSFAIERTGTWSPTVDVYETDKDYVIRAELPGIDRKDIEIEVKENALTLKGEKKREEEVKEENYYLLERCYGSFSRTFTLPPIADLSKASASYRDGVLEVRVPKREEAKPQKIKIES